MRALLRSCLAGAALCFSATAVAAGASAVWNNLWWTPDQQGQRLLQSDRPGEAAQRFSDPRRQAYADMRAGQYAQATGLLAPFHDAQSEYNRGNALARSGRLQDALSAYDAALAKSPNDRDARHNRDLVARALRQSAQQHGGSAGQPGSSTQPGGNPQQNPGMQHNDGAQQNGNPQQNGNAQPHRDAQPRGSGDQHSGAGHNEPRQGGGQPSGVQPQGPGQSAQAAQAAQAAAAAQANAGRGQSTAVPLAQQDAGNGSSSANPSNALQPLARAPASDDSAPKAPSEQALSLEQWLRRIPDDPGGLLRRKFLIEHLTRQQDAGQSAAQ